MENEAQSEIKVQEFDALVERIFKLRDEIEEANRHVSGKQMELKRLKAQAVLYLHELNRKNFKSALGTVRIAPKWQVRMPATVPDKLAFFEWLKERNIFDTYATVNSRSLNSLVAKEMDLAVKAGTAMEFSIPGIEQPTLFEDLGIRSANSTEGDDNE